MTQAQKQEQVEISKSPNLKEKLDEIDQTVYQEVHEGYKKSRMKVLVGMWEKGKVIGDSRGGETANWRELEHETGRNHESLKFWHDLYGKYPDRQRYITEYAEPKAEEWTRKALNQKWTALLESGSPEWWTPQKYIDAIREVMGEIDLDPVSCALANKVVKAIKYYDSQ